MSHALQGIVILREICLIAGFWSMLNLHYQGISVKEAGIRAKLIDPALYARGWKEDNIKREIESIDRQINALVYELYGLTEEEIKIVESWTLKVSSVHCRPVWRDDLTQQDTRPRGKPLGSELREPYPFPSPNPE